MLAGIRQFLDASPDVDQTLPHGASLAKFGDYYIEIGMLVTPPCKHTSFVPAATFDTRSEKVARSHALDCIMFLFAANNRTTQRSSREQRFEQTSWLVSSHRDAPQQQLHMQEAARKDKSVQKAAVAFSQAHGVKENAGNFAGFQQKMLQEIEAVIR